MAGPETTLEDQDKPGQIQIQEPEPKSMVAAPPRAGIVGLAADIKDLKKHFDQFTQLKQELLTEDDYYEIKTKNGTEKAIGKSGWYKFGVAFNITTIIVHQTKEWLDQAKGLYFYKTKVQGIAPNGRIAEDIGICDNTENDRKGESEHVISAMSITRAKERVYITLLGAPEKGESEPQEKCKCPPDVQANTPLHKGKCGNCGKARA